MYKDDYKIKRRLNTKRWRENHPDEVRKYSRLYEQREKTKLYRKKYSKSKGALNAKKWRDNNPERAKDATLKYWYGIRIEQYKEILKKQDGKCAICKLLPIDSSNLCVDHIHETGVVRGLLCHACNSGLGHFKDKVDNLLEAIKYLNLPR